MKFFLYARTAQTISVFFDLHSIIFFACQAASIFIQFTVVKEIWNFPKSIDTTDKSHLLVLLMAKCVIVGIWIMAVRIGGGDGLATAGIFWYNDEELENPEKFWLSEITRGLNCQRNNAENDIVFVLGCLFLGVSGVPLSLLYGFAVTRLVHNLAYLLHIPQPVRALSWSVGMFFAGKLMLQFF